LYCDSDEKKHNGRIVTSRIVKSTSRFGVGWERVLFTEELLLEAAGASLDVFNFLSKAGIVAYYLNSKLSKNQDESPEDWELIFSSVLGG